MVLTVTKPTVGGSEDTWGTTINTALDAIVLEINSNADGTNAITPNLTEGLWEISATAVTASAAELNILDTATVTTAELNILDGDTAAISTTVVDADRVVFNDDGTMKQVAMSDLKTYINASVGSGSVTEVAMTVPTGLTVSGTPITTSGTLAVSLQSGYSIPTTSSQSNWNTAYGWGDHSTQGYLTSAPAPTTAQVQTATAGMQADDVGSYAFLKGSIGSENSTVSGSVMRFSNYTAIAGNFTSSSGTWRRMGSTLDTGPTVYLRIS